MRARLLDPVALSLAARYLRSRRHRFAALITWVSVAGMCLGVLVLTVVISVMNGFDAELKSRLLGTVPQLLIDDVQRSDPAIERTASIPEVEDAYDFFLGAGMVTRGGAVNPVSVYGIDPETPEALAMLRRHMVYGLLEDLTGDGRRIAVGAPLAGHLGLLPGDAVALILTTPDAAGPRPSLHRFELAATFEIGAELDYSLVVVALDDLAEMGLADAGQSGVRLTLTNPLLAEGLARQIRREHPDWFVQSWSESYGELFQAVRLEKLLMFLILLMVVAVAAFNIVSGQMMVVTDKRSDIAILRTMGASAWTIGLAFLLQGVLVSSAGILLGLGLGVITASYISEIVALMKDWFGFGLLDGTYFVEVPSLVIPGDLLLIGALSWLLSLISAWLPARRAARLNPIDGLHA